MFPSLPARHRVSVEFKSTSRASLWQRRLPRPCIAGTFTLTPRTTRLTKWHKGFWSLFFFHGRREEHEWVWKSYIKQWKAERKVKGQRELAMSRATGTKVHRWCDDRVEVERVEDECHGVSQALAALQFVPLLPVSGRRDTDVHYVVARRLIVCRSVRYLLLWHNAVDFCRGKLKEDKTQWGSWFVLTLYKWFDIYVYVAVKLPYDIMLKIKDVWLGPYQPQASKLHL